LEPSGGGQGGNAAVLKEKEKKREISFEWAHESHDSRELTNRVKLKSKKKRKKKKKLFPFLFYALSFFALRHRSKSL
jgi:oligoribonuclease (3'-5' exoribonuclease)